MAGLRQDAQRLLREEPNALEVRLFGSLARRDATPGSDADLLVVLRDGAGPFLERAPRLARYFATAGLGCDVLAYTESELQQMLDEGNAFVRTACEEGIILAGRSEEASRVLQDPQGRPSGPRRQP